MYDETNTSVEFARGDRRGVPVVALADRCSAIFERWDGDGGRSRLEQVICEEVSALPWVSLCAIAEPTGDHPADAALRASAGPQAEYLERALDRPPESDPAVREPTQRCMGWSRPLFVEVGGASNRHGQWERSAAERSIDAAYCLPIVAQGVHYGVFSLYSTDGSILESDSVQSTLALFAGMLGPALDGALFREAMLADRVVTLEIAVPEREHPLATLARERQCEVLVRSAHQTDLGWIARGRLEGTDRSLVESGRPVNGLSSFSIVSEHETGLRFEAIVDDDPLIAATATVGVVPTAIRYDGALARLTIEGPKGVRARPIVDALRERYPQVELLSRRVLDRPVRRGEDVSARLTSRLTDRQREALEAAYYAGYFEWPRARTGEEVAQSLSISQPTFNRHFRSGLRTVFDVLFEGE